MLDATPFLRLYARRRNARLNAIDPASVQKVQLLKLVRQARETKFGKEYGFDTIDSVEEYQRRVPLRKYEQFWEDFWKADFPRLDNCSWPGLVPFFPVSSGTSSGTTKFIPCTKEMLASNSKAGLDLLVHHVTNRPHSKIFGGKSFLLGGSTDLTSPTPGVFCGDLSGIAAKTLPWWARARYFPPPHLTVIKNWEEKIDTVAKLSLKEDIRMISGVPAWMLIFFDTLSKLVPDRNGKVASIYKNLELIVHGGVNFGPYVQRFHDVLEGSKAELREVYPASEGFVAVADRGYGDGMRLNLDVGIFFEFVPVSELDSSSPTRHTVAEIQPEVNYAVVLTTCAGLWSYVLGDTVKFVDVSTPRLLVTGRTSYFLSAFGEHLIAEEIDDAVVAAARSIGSDVTDYTVGPVFPEGPGDLGGHIFLVEFAEKAPTESEMSQFIEKLDGRLCERNEDYEAHRSQGFGLKPPALLVVKTGGFAAWMKSRGKLGGQNKVPRIINDNNLLSGARRFITNFNASL